MINFKKIIIAFTLLLANKHYSQNTTACVNAMSICTNSVSFPLTVGGTGLNSNDVGGISNPTTNPQGVNAGCLWSAGSGSKWLTFTITQSGNLGFSMGG